MKKNYHCKYCKTLVQSPRVPNMTGCPKHIVHEWNDLGLAGTIAYQCKRCGIIVMAERHPNMIMCQDGYTHNWIKL